MTGKSRMFKRMIILAVAASIMAASGCGKQQDGEEAGTFIDALGEKAVAGGVTKQAEIGDEAMVLDSEPQMNARASASSTAEAHAVPSLSPNEEATPTSESPATSTAEAQSTTAASTSSTTEAQSTTAESASSPAVSQSPSEAPTKTPAVTQAPSGPSATPVAEERSPSESSAAPLATSVPAATVASSKKYTPISWNGFFDNEDQSTPSDAFWDLSEANKTVQIKGFMGEVMSFENNWFLLIPEPGAECPFDNGDETYWNKIMIVFVKDSDKLRYTSAPLQLTGRLDVGIKVDESGYKTMFRIYDAKVEVLKD
ncbi:hypothetical protein [Paenibacillus sp. HB172176]|uniref:hypothetical protein n=1 Tax=Paenibacillus sp. HB172176 TaxID=2493690 RepID=UPI00143C3EE5|nr:hypothetical protein [Paenibacillus sp. HB172176]